MPSEESAGARGPIISDEDWKERVKAEAAALDQKIKAESAQAQSGPSGASGSGQAKTGGARTEAMPVPPADFSTLIAMLSSQALVALGVIPNPATGNEEPHLELARHFVDLLSAVEEKTKGNLDREEEALLTSTLHHLRMAYVDRTKNAEH